MFKHKVGQKSIFKSIILFLLLFLTACQTGPVAHIRETEEFYINDRPNVLLNATKWTIFAYSEDLYEDSQYEEYQDAGISGAQVVVVTYIGSAGDFSSTDLFNAWGIGENDMGLLLILFFDEENNYQETVYEMGLKMMGYLSAFTMDGLVTEYFDDPSIPSYDFDQRLISLYFGIMEYIYLNIYDYNTFDYQSFIDEYDEIKYNYLGPLPSASEKDPLPWWAWTLIIIAIVVFGAVPGGFIFPYMFSSSSRGRGGRSLGYWFRR